MKVVVVDDDAIVAASLKMILNATGDIDVVAVGNDGSDAIKLYEEYLPDVLLTDIQMKEVSGLEATAEILKKYPGAKVILLTTFLDDEYVREAIKIGAKGYILKQDYEGIGAAVRSVCSGQNVYGGEIIGRLPELLEKEHNTQVYFDKGITEKEYEIIELVAEGLSNKEIAEKLFLSDGTVRNYLSSILEKLELRDRTQLAVYYYKHKEKA